MALTRKSLEAMGIDEAKIDSIIEMHTEVTNALKGERDSAKALAATAEQLTQERDALKVQVDKLMKNGSDAIKVQQEFDNYKAQVEQEKLTSGKKNAVAEMFRKAGVNRNEFLEFLQSKVDLGTVELENGAVKGADELVKPLKEAYGGFFGTVQSHGTEGLNPPNNGNGGAMTKEAFEKLNLGEQCVFANEHPAEYAAFYKK